MPAAAVTFHFPQSSFVKGSEENVNLLDLVNYINGALITDSFTALSASDVTGPTGTSLLMFVRDTTNGGSALVHYESGATPTVVSAIASAGTTFVTGAAGAGQIEVKDGTGKIQFRAHSSRNNASLKTVTIIGGS